MNIVERVLNDKVVREKYEAIDKINPYPFNHGMKHINNVVKLSDELTNVFELSERELEMLKVAEILHDLGQVEGREKHGERAAIFAREYLPKLAYFSEEEVNTICSAIKTHDEHSDYAMLETDFSWFVNFIDKMDFSRYRLDDNCQEKFGQVEYVEIERVRLERKGNRFLILIETIPNPQIISEAALFSKNFFNKVIRTAKNFCDHFNFELEMYLGNDRLKIENIDESLPLNP